MAWSLQEFADAGQQTGALAQAVREGLEQALRARGQAVLAVSGGRSPIPLFTRLRELDLDWSRVTLTLVDERLVPPGHPDSNESLVREHLLQGRAAQARLLGLATDPALDLQECLRRARLEQPRADLALLGMGEDGHTASLFPGAAGIESALDPACPERYVGVIPPAAAHTRISMSLAALLECPGLLLAIAGPAKRRVFEAACADPRSSLPVARLLHQARVTVRSFWAA
ncbi:6-phosphogluconolactonase [Thiomonas sp. FB-6]|jgi:6-phosphogluconolactonase|uniref:6-phosphogluconolactonase n=1 Tax=Thiomonas sp. FB-6 TaxID=1158291 RepID=UPI00037EA4A6|nr:6-phosphogluconolactonase [Thiomonas sp. FB-6]